MKPQRMWAIVSPEGAYRAIAYKLPVAWALFRMFQQNMKTADAKRVGYRAVRVEVREATEGDDAGAKPDMFWPVDGDRECASSDLDELLRYEADGLDGTEHAEIKIDCAKSLGMKTYDCWFDEDEEFHYKEVGHADPE